MTKNIMSTLWTPIREPRYHPTFSSRFECKPQDNSAEVINKNNALVIRLKETRGDGLVGIEKIIVDYRLRSPMSGIGPMPVHIDG